MAWVATFITAVVGATTVALGYMLKRSISIAIVIGAVVVAIGSFKQDIVNLVYDARAKQEASEVRRLELERERMRLEAEERDRLLKYKSAQAARQERAEQRRLDEKMADVQLELLKPLPKFGQ